MHTRHGPCSSSGMVGVGARRPRRLRGLVGMPVIRRFLQGRGGWVGCLRWPGWGESARTDPPHRLRGQVGVLLPEVVEEYGEGFGGVVEFFVGHGNGVDAYDTHRDIRFLSAGAGGFRTTALCGGTGMRMVRIPPD